jgi:hypothetical protein
VCLEAEARGQLVFGKATEFAKGNHADFLLNRLILGKRDGVAGVIGEHQRAVFDLHIEVESDPHDSSSHLVMSMLAECTVKVYTEFMHKIKNRVSRGEVAELESCNGYRHEY